MITRNEAAPQQGEAGSMKSELRKGSRLSATTKEDVDSTRFDHRFLNLLTVAQVPHLAPLRDGLTEAYGTYHTNL